MATIPALFKNNSDVPVVVIPDDVQCSSLVKEFFSDLYITMEKNRWTAKCKKCSLPISDTLKTTSNFVKHMKNKHQHMYGEWKNTQVSSSKENDQPKINNIFSPDSEKYSTANKRQQQLTNSIIQNLIINMSLPLSIVDNASFKHFMNDVDPKYKLINRRDITRSYLPVLHKKCVSKLQDICARSNYISLTLDIWSDRRLRSYFGITLHTIINDIYKSFLISFERLEGTHSADKIAAEFDRVIQLYNLKDKVVRLITDNASNNLAAFDNIILPGFEEYFEDVVDDQLDTESSSDEETDITSNESKRLQTHVVDDSIYQTTLNPTAEDEYLRLPCFAHCLQLVVNDGIKASNPALSSLKKVASLAKLAHTSTIFSEKLEKANYSIPKANRTRWNSQFHTVKRVINIPSSTLNTILNDMKKNDLILTTKDRKILEDFTSLFELFNEATVLTQGETYATVSFVAPTVLGILFDLERELASSTLTLVSLCKALIASIKARFSGLLRHFEIEVPSDSYCMSERFSDPIFLISPLFDARFKLLWLESFHTIVKLRVIEKIRNMFVRFFCKLTFYTAQNVQADVSNAGEQGGTDIITKNNDSSTKRKCLFPYLHETKKVSSDDKSRLLMELDSFLCEESCEENLLFDKKHLYPCLYQLALKYLSVPATSASIERIFSQSGFIMRPHRASLTAKNVCLLTFLKCNKMLM
ncbi:unnamed protein product [Adineta steineri]|uniref:HAT C-terminal dimerisation domain-containing protein n=1 Tax=Adineta steineri TaxID=433720 RepID=A0A816DDA2_9BILA|nr:unnamed protein product [Adineta steineri]